jgi:hypothetical protein
MYCDVLPIDESDYAFFAALYARYKLPDMNLNHPDKARKALRAAVRKARQKRETARQAARQAVREAERVRAEAEAARILQNEAAERARARKEEEFKVAQQALYEVRALLRLNHKNESHPLRKALRAREKSCLERISFL